MGIFRDRTTANDRTEVRRDAELDEREDARARAAEAEAREAEHAEERERAAYDDRGHDRTRREEVVHERPVDRPAVHPIALARDRFGGIDVPASLVGMLAALALVTLLGGIAGAAFGVYGYQTGLDGVTVEEAAIGTLIVAWVVLFVSYLVGGWTAGRIARYDGARNGLMTAVWTIVLAAILSATAAVLGDQYDVFANVNLPQWFTTDALTTTALITGAIALATMLVAGLLGGLWGTRYHRIADETLLDVTDAPDDVHPR